MSHIVNTMLAGLAAAILILAGYGLMAIADDTRPVYAASSAPPCTPIASTGNIVISRCEDDKMGQVLYVNNIGFMVLEQ